MIITPMTTPIIVSNRSYDTLLVPLERQQPQHLNTEGKACKTCSGFVLVYMMM